MLFDCFFLLFARKQFGWNFLVKVGCKIAPDAQCSAPKCYSVYVANSSNFLLICRYWCSYGPEDYREVEPHIGENSSTKPATGKGSRPGRRHMMRGCLCHFTVKRLYTRPLLALIIYNQRTHVDKTGSPCHGLLDQEAVGTRAMYAPRISEELRQKVLSMLHAGISLDTIVQHHLEEVQRHGGPHNRDDFLTRNDVRNMERLIRNSSHELHPDDNCSVKMWAQRHHKNVFYFQESTGSEPFILGIQTDWQLQQLLRYGHSGLLASHSTSGSKKLKVAICFFLATSYVFKVVKRSLQILLLLLTFYYSSFSLYRFHYALYLHSIHHKMQFQLRGSLAPLLLAKIFTNGCRLLLKEYVARIQGGGLMHF